MEPKCNSLKSNLEAFLDYNPSKKGPNLFSQKQAKSWPIKYSKLRTHELGTRSNTNVNKQLIEKLQEDRYSYLYDQCDGHTPQYLRADQNWWRAWRLGYQDHEQPPK